MKNSADSPVYRNSSAAGSQFGHGLYSPKKHLFHLASLSEEYQINDYCGGKPNSGKSDILLMSNPRLDILNVSVGCA